MPHFFLHYASLLRFVPACLKAHEKRKNAEQSPRLYPTSVSKGHYCRASTASQRHRVTASSGPQNDKNGLASQPEVVSTVTKTVVRLIHKSLHKKMTNKHWMDRSVTADESATTCCRLALHVRLKGEKSRQQTKSHFRMDLSECRMKKNSAGSVLTSALSASVLLQASSPLPPHTERGRKRERLRIDQQIQVEHTRFEITMIFFTQR